MAGPDQAVAAQSSTALAPTSSSSSAIFCLHPLPILSISEHIIRSHVQRSDDDKIPTRVYGVLLGTQSGRHVEIHNTFEIKVDGSGKLDNTFFRARQAQFKQTFPTFDVLGWYSNGSEPTQLDLEIHKQFIEFNESPLFLQVSPDTRSFRQGQGKARQGGELPLALYESQMELVHVGGEAQSGAVTSSASKAGETDVTATPICFVRSSGYRIETGEAERIAVDYTSKPSGSTAQGGRSTSGHHGAMIASLEAQQAAIRMLQSRIQYAHQYVATLIRPNISVTGQEESSQKSGSVVPPVPSPDHEVLRRLKAILATLPSSNGNSQAHDGQDDFDNHFLREYNDALLTASLSGMTQNLHRLNELVDKFDLVQSASDTIDGNGEGSMGGGGGRMTRSNARRGGEGLVAG